MGRGCERPAGVTQVEVCRLVRQFVALPLGSRSHATVVRGQPARVRCVPTPVSGPVRSVTCSSVFLMAGPRRLALRSRRGSAYGLARGHDAALARAARRARPNVRCQARREARPAASSRARSAIIRCDSWQEPPSLPIVVSEIPQTDRHGVLAEAAGRPVRAVALAAQRTGAMVNHRQPRLTVIYGRAQAEVVFVDVVDRLRENTTALETCRRRASAEIELGEQLHLDRS